MGILQRRPSKCKHLLSGAYFQSSSRHSIAFTKKCFGLLPQDWATGSHGLTFRKVHSEIQETDSRELLWFMAGHKQRRSYLKRIGIEEKDSCRLCGQKVSETSSQMSLNLGTCVKGETFLTDNCLPKSIFNPLLESSIYSVSVEFSAVRLWKKLKNVYGNSLEEAFEM